jgi:DNA-directed RNA polymerase specialized sigma24 family protein
MATAKHRWIDRLRRRSLHLRKISELGAELQRTSPATPSHDEDVVDDEVGDDVCG